MIYNYKYKYECKNNYKPALLFQLCLNGIVFLQKYSDLDKISIGKNLAQALEENDKLTGKALSNATKKWHNLLADNLMASLIEARKLGDLKLPDNSVVPYFIILDVDSEDISVQVNSGMYEKTKKMSDFIKKVEDTVKEFTIVQAFKEAALKFEEYKKTVK